MRDSRKPLKDNLLRVRVDRQFKDTLHQVAMLQRLDDADIVRIACGDYFAKFTAPRVGVFSNG